MTTVSIAEIQRDLRGYLRRVKAGETLLIVQAEQPIAELKPVSGNIRKRRPFGLCKGEFHLPDDFDEPLPEEIIRHFEGP